MIELDNVSVHFRLKGRVIRAVREASLAIGRGEKFGIVGASGAGKSTLLRTVNLLEKPTSGRVRVDGTDVTDLPAGEVRRVRTGIGMIFQHFNLMHTQTVAGNVAFPMRVAGRPGGKIKERVGELLELVELADRADAYPAQLSGGQKQRVGIARALANAPGILLCDEPTSALDLETTASILELLNEINARLGITILLISHEMGVIKSVCQRVAVMQAGRIVEQNSVYSLFGRPEHRAARELVERSLDLSLPPRIVEGLRGTLLRVVYGGRSAEEPVIAETARRFRVTPNILHGKIEYIGGRPLGVLIVAVEGEAADVRKAVMYLQERTEAAEVLHAGA